jgi:hypothetical protein
MAKNVNDKTTKVPKSGKSGLKSQIKATRVGATKFRLALNHNETLAR